jgi:hypothetical protein
MKIEAMKPGLKNKKKISTPDKRKRVAPSNKSKYPKLKTHKNKPND